MNKLLIAIGLAATMGCSTLGFGKPSVAKGYSIAVTAYTNALPIMGAYCATVPNLIESCTVPDSDICKQAKTGKSVCLAANKGVDIVEKARKGIDNVYAAGGTPTDVEVQAATELIKSALPLIMNAGGK